MGKRPASKQQAPVPAANGAEALVPRAEEAEGLGAADQAGASVTTACALFE
jgi:hypothetical protein